MPGGGGGSGIFKYSSQPVSPVLPCFPVCLFLLECKLHRAGISVSLIALSPAPSTVPGTMEHAQWAFAEEMNSLNCEFLHTHAHMCDEIQGES